MKKVTHIPSQIDTQTSLTLNIDWLDIPVVKFDTPTDLFYARSRENRMKAYIKMSILLGINRS